MSVANLEFALHTLGTHSKVKRLKKYSMFHVKHRIFLSKSIAKFSKYSIIVKEHELCMLRVKMIKRWKKVYKAAIVGLHSKEELFWVRR